VIEVELSAAEVPIEPGGTAKLSVTITNRQAHDDHVFLEIEGIDMEWYALPVPAVNVASGGTQCAHVLFKIPRSSESRAGTYPLIVRARAMESGIAGLQQAALIIKSYNALQIELNPKRATSSVFRRANDFEVSVSNLGNQEETLDLYASDPEDACAYEFDTDRITLKPGHTQSVLLRVEPVTRPFLGSSRLFGFSVSSRSVTDSYISASTHGQLERRAALSTVTAIILILLLLGASGWALFRPRPVAIQYFSVSPQEVLVGEEITLSWGISNLGEGSYIQPINHPITKGYDSLKLRLDQTTSFVLIARGRTGKDQQRTIQVVVRPKPAAPKPEITEFNATRSRIHQGENITLAWQVKNVSTIVINPLGQQLDPQLYRRLDVKPEQTTEYELAAKGADGSVVTKTVKIEVVAASVCIAEIKGFRAQPGQIAPGEKAALIWTVDNAASIEIEGVGSGLKSKDRIEVSPDKTTTYILRAIDSRGNAITRSVTVNVTKPEIAPPPSNDGVQPTQPIPDAPPPPSR
jgi:hypothetical protein